MLQIGSRPAGSRVLMSAAESGAFKGAGTTTYFPCFVCPVPAGALPPGATLEFGGQINKYPTANGGHNLKVTLAQGATEVVLTQAFINATLLFFNWRAELTLSADRKFGFMDSVNVFNTAGGSVPAGSYTSYVAKTAVSANLSARTRSGAVAFATYSAPPTAETRLIDFDQPCELRFYLSCVAADTVEMKQGYARVYSAGSAYAEFAGPKATLFYGHSLPEGTGATAGNDVVSQLRALRIGRPIANLGLGGQKYSAAGGISFADRILADPAAAYRDLIIWGPENDATGDGPGWWNIVATRLAEIMAFRRAGTKTIICNSVTSQAWAAGIIAAAQYVNAQLAASPWAGLVADMYTPICTQPDGKPNPTYLSDDIHHNDAGYGVDANTIHAKMTALGWA